MLSLPVFDTGLIYPFSTGLQKYRYLFGLEPETDFITLGEGNTPLVAAHLAGHPVYLKMESQNPTGSYKDRGTVVLVNLLKSRGVEFAIEDSSGNAGASFAAYCARVAIRARVFIPESASGPKRRHIELSGADLVSVPGERAEAAKQAALAVGEGIVYASHAWMPFGLAGIATIAYEIVEQLGVVPGSVIAPVGHGGLLYGVMLGFENMLKSGFIAREPFYVGVQPTACAPITRAYHAHELTPQKINPGETWAEGVKVTQPLRAKPILSRLVGGKGCMLSIEEESLRTAWKDAALHGFYMEPTSALVWAALQTHVGDFKSPVVALITGSGYKSSIL